MTARWAVTLASLVTLGVVCAPAPASAQHYRPEQAWSDQIVDPSVSADEHGHAFEAKPEIFIQTRLSRGLTPDADPGDTPRNFQLTRAETRWSGRLTDHIGGGFELQYHPAAEGAADQIINDAFIEFYAPRQLTIRAGQFIKPFGFDIQQSSADREYPERGMFAGYWFPGQRDRGVMVMWDLAQTLPALGETQVYAALLNGNRVFNDNDGRLDTLVRVRHVVPGLHVAVGASGQFGSQIVPPGTVERPDARDVRLAGLDVQCAFGRLGVRSEWVHGTRPSTLLSREPEFTAAFAPGTTTTGWATTLLVSVTASDQAYGRFDYIGGDPMTGGRIRAIDSGYRRILSDTARLSVNYQHKDAPSGNDDGINTRFQITLGVTF